MSNTVIAIGTGSAAAPMAGAPYGNPKQYVSAFDAIGGLAIDEFGGYAGLPMWTGSTDIGNASAASIRTNFLSKSFGSSSGSVVQALNHLKGLIANADDLTWAEIVAVAAGADSAIDFNSQNFTQVGTLGVGAVTSTGAGSFGGALDCDTSLTIDAVTITDTEIGYLDGITAIGTAQASKAVVLDASANLAGLGTLGCGAITSTGGGSFGGALDCDTSLTIDSVVVESAEFGVLAGVTAGTVAASKALVVDGSKNIATIGTVGCGAITSTGASSFGSVTSAGAGQFATLSSGGTFEVGTTSQFGGQVNNGGFTKVSSSHADFSAGTFAAISQATFNKIPGLTLQGVKSDGKMADFKLQVSGGILMAVAQ
jgi:hypothetical protein